MPGRAAKVLGEPLFDIRAFGRPGPADRMHIRADMEQLMRTVARTPEVMVKVSGGAKSVKGAIAHLRYIDRDGELEVETDEGSKLKGEEVAHALVWEWDLEASRAHARSPYRGQGGRRPAKLLHNVILSMPRGTPPDRLFAASRAFAREQFGLEHRYALVLHTDQDHPHVHLVVKAVSEEGKRLNIRTATLREWRRQFAHHLRAQGIAANATERAARGQVRGPVRDGIYRAALRGQSTHHQARLERIAQAARSGRAREPAATKLQETRRAVVQGWNAAADRALEDGLPYLAEQIWKFIGGMPPPQTEDERLRTRLSARMDGDRRQERDALSR